MTAVGATAAALFAVAAGCGSSASSGADAAVDAGEVDAGGDVLHPPPIQRTETEATLSVKRAACAFDAGAWPAETIGTEYPVGDDIPIKHVVVIMQENRSFDHYLGRLVAQGYYAPGNFSDDGGDGLAHADQLDGPPPGWSNPDGTDGGVVTPHFDTQQCFTGNHSWNDMHEDWNDGGMDRFVVNNNPGGHKSFFYEDDTVIPFYYALASTFAVGDRAFASVMTSTWPNRLYLMGATSYGVGDNSVVTLDTFDHPAPQIFSLLEAAGRTWKDYTDGPHQVLFYPWFGFQRSTLDRFADVKCGLLSDIQNGTLPDVAFVMGSEIGETSDEGPSALAGIGGVLVEQIVRALFASPSWKDTALFITYDENGGMADHVPPIPACEPDGLLPHDEKNVPLPGRFDRTGFRVPFIVVSPYARKHYVSHVPHDHTAITRFIEARFGLPALTRRDANATPPMDMFDFKSPPFMTPPAIAATTKVDPAVLSRCGQVLAPLGCK